MKTMKKLLLIIYLTLGSVHFTNGQNAFQIDTTSIISANYDSNGNAFLLGYKGPTSYLIKMDPQNNIEWIKKPNSDRELESQFIMGNDIYVMARESSNIYVKYLTKISTNGVQLWTKTITNNEYSYNFINTPVIVNSNPQIGILFQSQNSIIIQIINSGGFNIWQKEIPTQSTLPCLGLIGTSDNSGNIYISYHCGNSIYIVKLDQNGNLLLHKEYNDPLFKYGNTKMVIEGNEIILLCHIYNLAAQPVILKIDFSGNILEFKKITTPFYTFCRDFLIENGNFYLVGTNFSPGNPDKPFLAKTDTNFNSVNFIESGYASEAYTLSKYQNEFLITTNGYTSKFDAGLKFHCDTVKTNYTISSLTLPTYVQSYSQITNAVTMNNSSLTLTNTQLTSYQNCIPNEINENEILSNFSLYPNPSSSYFTLEFEGETQNPNYSIHDILGKEILSGKINSMQTTIHCENWSSGVYLIKMGDENGYRVEKIIIEK